MALSGQLSDLSLAELIEFFCNQRKTGRLKIAYQLAPGYFYFDRGELVDAKIGALIGVDAVYYALTLENASFKFSTAFEATRRTIHQPWAHVALEGLRRLDEGVTPKEAFPEGMLLAHDDEPEDDDVKTEKAAVSEKASPSKTAQVSQSAEPEQSQAPLQFTVESSRGQGRSRTLVYAAVIAALVLSVAAIGFPAGWYGKRKSVAAAPAATAPDAKAESSAPTVTENNQTDSSTAQAEEAQSGTASTDANNLASRQQQQEREREARAAYLAAQERERAQQAAKQSPTLPGQPAPANTGEVKKPETPAPAQKRTVTVQVTYDENGRVTQTSGGDGMSQRIARQKRFPTGKSGTATVTIPVN
ncbi:MAG TPA: DUF4388 domain-containing protein [Pyrinomonadaceae bacterium]|jgi:stringent starvation protein B